MRIDRSTAPMPPAVLEAEIDVAIEKTAQDQQKQEGSSVVSMIENAGVNRPLDYGTVGRTINIGV